MLRYKASTASVPTNSGTVGSNHTRHTDVPTVIYFLTVLYGGTWWCSWLRHCATNRKVAGSIHDGVIGIFY